MMTRDQVQRFCAFLVTNRYITGDTLAIVLREYDLARGESRRLSALHATETYPRAGAVLIVQVLASINRWLAKDCEPIALADRWIAQSDVSDTVAEPARAAAGRSSGRLPPQAMPPIQPAAPPQVPLKRFGDKLVPSRIGDFDIEKPLGEGGMGAVFLARHRITNLRVALKLMAEDLPGRQREQDPERTKEMRERFRREAIAAIAVSSPHVVRGYHLGEDDGMLYQVMELIPGQELSKYVQTLPKDDATTAIRLVRDVCRGVGAFHNKGLLHRDIKPANVMVDTSGCPKVIDSGLVRAVDGGDVVMAKIDVTKSKPDDVELTNQATVGTPMYMSPEQAMSLPVGKPTDVYSLGKVLVFALTELFIHEGKNTIELLRKIMSEGPLPSAVVSAVKHRLPFGGASKKMLAIIDKAVAFQPTDRYPDANAMAEALDEFLTWQQQRKQQEAAEQAAQLEANEQALAKERAAKRRLFIGLGIACSFSILLLLVSIFFAKAKKEAQARAEAETLAATSARAAEAEQKLRADIGSQFLESQALMRSCKWVEAEALLVRMLERDVSYEAAHDALARVQFNLRKPSCIDQWLWLIEHGSEARRSEYAFYAIFYTQQLRPAETDAPYEALMNKISDPRYVGLARAELAFTRAERASRRMEASEALALMLPALTQVPTIEETDELSWLAKAVRGGILWRLSQIVTGSEQTARRLEARLVLQESIAKNPDFPMTWYWLADILRENGEHAAAIAAFERLVQLMPNWPPPHYLKAGERMSVASVVNANDSPEVVERKVRAAFDAANETIAVCRRVLAELRPEPLQVAMAKMTMLNALTLRFSLERRREQPEAAERTRAEIYTLGDELLADRALPASERAAAEAILQQVRSRK